MTSDIIQCKKCKLSYVGQTRRSLRARIAQHLRNVRSFSCDTPLYHHFSSVCPFNDFSFKGIELHPSDDRRLQKEAKWIEALDTRVPKGLNVITRPPVTSNLILPFGQCSSRVTSAVKRWCEGHVDLRTSYTRSRNLSELLSRNHLN